MTQPQRFLSLCGIGLLWVIYQTITRVFDHVSKHREWKLKTFSLFSFSFFHFIFFTSNLFLSGTFVLGHSWFYFQTVTKAFFKWTFPIFCSCVHRMALNSFLFFLLHEFRYCIDFHAFFLFLFTSSFFVTEATPLSDYHCFTRSGGTPEHETHSVSTDLRD